VSRSAPSRSANSAVRAMFASASPVPEMATTGTTALTRSYASGSGKVQS
jgi:hypothetical protein